MSHSNFTLNDKPHEVQGEHEHLVLFYFRQPFSILDFIILNYIILSLGPTVLCYLNYFLFLIVQALRPYLFAYINNAYYERPKNVLV